MGKSEQFLNGQVQTKCTESILVYSEETKSLFMQYFLSQNYIAIFLTWFKKYANFNESLQILKKSYGQKFGQKI